MARKETLTDLQAAIESKIRRSRLDATAHLPEIYLYNR